MGGPAQAQQINTAGPLIIPVLDLEAKTAGFFFAAHGDAFERYYWPCVAERFPNCERFWQRLVTPSTNRVCDGEDRNLYQRAGVADDVVLLTHLHYSAFLHLAAAFDHLPIPPASDPGRPHSLTDFYVHLASAFDLVEDFLIRAFMISAECRGTPVPELQPYSEDEFIDHARGWYRQHYAKAHAHYLAKGKSQPVQIPSREKIIDKYMSGESASRPWKSYRALVGPIRQYRNRMAHNIALGTVIAQPYHLVPRKDKVGSYPTIKSVMEVASDAAVLGRDFVIRETQMMDDFGAVLTCLNALWEKPFDDLDGLLYREKNPVLMAKYNIELQ